jgi:TolA-binding protein
MWAKKTFLPLLAGVFISTGCMSIQRNPWSDKEAIITKASADQANISAFNEAISLTESLHYEEAAIKFRQVFDGFSVAGDQKRASESLFWLGFCREKQRRLEEARAIYMRVAGEYRGTRSAYQACQRLARLSDAATWHK